MGGSGKGWNQEAVPTGGKTRTEGEQRRTHRQEGQLEAGEYPVSRASVSSSVRPGGARLLER